MKKQMTLFKLYQDVANKLVMLMNEQTYGEKEKLISSLAGLFNTPF